MRLRKGFRHRAKTAIDLYSIACSALALGFLVFVIFYKKKKRVTIKDKKRRQVLFLLGDNGGFCYETFGALVEALDTTAFY